MLSFEIYWVDYNRFVMKVFKYFILYVFTNSCSEISVKCISNIDNNNYNENSKRQQQN